MCEANEPYREGHSKHFKTDFDLKGPKCKTLLCLVGRQYIANKVKGYAYNRSLCKARFLMSAKAGHPCNCYKLTLYFSP